VLASYYGCQSNNFKNFNNSERIRKGTYEMSAKYNLSKIMNNRARELAGRNGHSLGVLLNNFKRNYPGFDIKRFEEAIEKINEFFNRRYPANTSASINLLTLNNIDEVFFLLRDLIHKDVSMSTIDEIAMKKDNGLKQSNPLFNYAYKENQFFRARKHKKTKFSDFKNPPKIITCGED